MKRLSCLILLLTLLLPGWAVAAMDSYCSAPPYVTRSIAPNIMVLMDNSLAMYGPAYTDGDAYSAGSTDDAVYNPASTYIGYFVPTSCYSYSGGKFAEELETPPHIPPAPPNPPPTCTAAAPFRGNLMNWATMSKYDVLQKVLIGGNSTSKQGNANTLLSIGGSFNDKVYNGCRFQVSAANLTITEDSAGACILLDNPAGVIAASPRRPVPSIGVLIGRLALPTDTGWSRVAARQKLPSSDPRATKTSDPPPSVLATAIAAIGGAMPSSELAAIWENASLVTKAWGATCTDPTLATTLTATINTPYSLRLNGMDINANGTVHTWDTTKPAWLNAPTYVDTSKITRYGIVWEGTPTAIGSSTVTASYSSNKCSPESSTITFTINVVAEPLKIVTPASTTTTLPSGTVGLPYNFTLFGQGGIKPVTWTATGLPAGLSVTTESDAIAGQNNYIGHITGTPTTAGTSTLTVTLTDSTSPTNLIKTSQSLSLTIDAGLTIATGSLPVGTPGSAYSATLAGVGGNPPYTWSITSGSLPSGMSMSSSGVFSGTIDAAATLGAYPITIRLEDSAGTTVSKDFTITVAAAVGYVTISTSSPLPPAYKGVPYTVDIVGTGGTTPYVWSIESGAPPGDPAMTISSVSGSTTAQLSWKPTEGTIGGTTYNFIIKVIGAGGHEELKTFSITSFRNAPAQRSASFSVKVDIDEEPLTDSNGNDIWDGTEIYSDINGNGQWDGKQGLFQKYWDDISPKARWGMTKFGSTGATVATCLPASPVASWYTGIQNATAADSSPLATGLGNAIKYFDFNGGFNGCTTADPIDDVPCRKNFILVISSGSNVTGDELGVLDADAPTCDQLVPLVKNACVGFVSDLRTEEEAPGKQNIYTYVVNTMGANAANNAILEAAADAGGGDYYDASDAATLQAKLTQAFQDILSQAASGTAVSVLTTSSRGIGSMVQAYFLPVRTDGTRDIKWTGYTQDLWIDPQDNLREDTVQDLALKPAEDKVIKLFFDASTNETKVARFTTLADGTGGSLASCDASGIEPFSATKYLWEAGLKLALRDDTTDRELMTAKKVIHGESVTHTFADPTFDITNVVTNNATLRAALNADATYTATKIVQYVRGVDLESSDANFRDRRLTVGDPAALHVWKLGDVISSTPKVFANTPANTYHIDYGDDTYYSYITGTGYKERPSVAFVGANDGVLHAIRVGYLKDTGLLSGVKGLFKDTFTADDDVNDAVGEEIWGYIPFNAFPYLKYLADPGYCHIYFNDLSTRIVDASVGNSSVDMTTFPAAAKATASWRSILIGGMRFGGACAGSTTPALPIAGVGYSAYYALDITDPTDPVPLWEFSDPDLGYATTFPSIVRTGNKTTNGNWYVAFGSGSTTMPKSSPSTDMNRTTPGYVYLLDLKSGALVKKVGLGHNAIVSDIVAVDSQKNAIVDTLYFGTSYSTGATTWGGKLMSLNVAGDVPGLCGTGVTRTAVQCDTNQKVLFNGAFPFTASPDVTRDPVGNTWLYAGSGKYFSDIDEGDIADNIFLGIKAKLVDGTSYPTIQIGVTDTADFIDRTNVETTGTVTSTRQECLYDPAAADKFSPQTVVTGINVTSTVPDVPPQGWYITLAAGERIISRPLAVGGLVDFLTYKPDSDLCSYGGNSFLYAVDYLRGVAPSIVAIRTPGSTTDADGAASITGDVTVRKGILLGPGAPPTGEAITIPPPKEGQEQLKKKIQVATGVIVEAENTPVISTISKVVHWLKK